MSPKLPQFVTRAYSTGTWSATNPHPIQNLCIKSYDFRCAYPDLGIKASKDKDGKAYLTEDQANQVRALRSHVEKTGKIEGFPNSIESGLVWAEPTDLLGEAVQQATQYSQNDNETDRPDLEDIIRTAAELKGHQLVMGDLVTLELANRLTYADLPEDVKQKVDRVREAANPKLRTAQLAENLLSKWRDQRSQLAA